MGKVEDMLHKRWIWGAHPHFLKKWNIEFDARSTHLDIIPTWVIILGLPLILWSKQFFEEIGNVLGNFYEVDLSHRELSYMGIDLILVGLDIRKGIM
jgi:hypothetical protein